MKKILFSVFYLVCFCVQAQSVETIISGSRDSYEGVSYEVVEYLELTPGFEFTASESNEFFARVKNVHITPVDDSQISEPEDIVLIFNDLFTTEQVQSHVTISGTKTGMLDGTWASDGRTHVFSPVFENDEEITISISDQLPTGEWGNWEPQAASSSFEINWCASNQLIVGQISVDTDLVCHNSDDLVLALDSEPEGGAGYYDYVWEKGTGTDFSTTEVLGHEPVQAGGVIVEDTKFMVTVTSCEQTETREVVIHARPALMAGSVSGEQTICFQEIPSMLVSEEVATGGDESYVYQWQQSYDGDNWEDIEDDSNELGYQPSPLEQSTYFRRVAMSCGEVRETNTILVTVLPDLGVPTATQDVFYACGPMSVDLSVQVDDGVGVRWYDENGVFLSEGVSYTTEELSEDAVFYARAFNSETGCDNTGQVALHVDYLELEPTFVSDNACRGESVTVTAVIEETEDYVVRWYNTSGGYSHDELLGEGITYLVPSTSGSSTPLYAVVSYEGQECTSPERIGVPLTVIPTSDNWRFRLGSDFYSCNGWVPAVELGADMETSSFVDDYSYQWERTDDQGNFVPAYNGKSYKLRPGRLKQTTTFRRNMSACGSSFSQEITIRVPDVPFSRYQPVRISDEPLCENERFSVGSVIAPGSLDRVRHTLQWQTSISGEEWTDISPVEENEEEIVLRMEDEDASFRYLLDVPYCGVSFVSDPVDVELYPPLMTTPIITGNMNKRCPHSSDGEVTVSFGNGAVSPDRYIYMYTSVDGENWERQRGERGGSRHFDLSSFYLETDTYFRAGVGQCGREEVFSEEPVLIEVYEPIDPGELTGGGIYRACGDDRWAETTGTSVFPDSDGARDQEVTWHHGNVNNHGVISWGRSRQEGRSSYTPTRWDNEHESVFYVRKEVTSCDGYYRAATEPVQYTVYLDPRPGEIGVSSPVVCSGGEDVLINSVEDAYWGDPDENRYRWYQSSSGEEGSWDLISTGDNSELLVSNITGSSYFRRDIRSHCGGRLQRASNVVHVGVFDEMSFLGQVSASPEDRAYNSGDFTLTGPNLSSFRLITNGQINDLNEVKWQERNEQGTWEDYEDYTRNVIIPFFVGERSFRVRWTTECDEVFSQPVTITGRPQLVAGTIEYTGGTTCVGASNFGLSSLTSAEGGDGNIEYVWESLAEGQTYWRSYLFESPNREDRPISFRPALHVDYQVRRRATSDGQTVYSNVVTVPVYDELVLSSDRVTEWRCEGYELGDLSQYITLSENNVENVTYNWEFYRAGHWRHVSANLNFAPSPLTESTTYRLTVSDGCGNDYTSEELLFYVFEGRSFLNSHPITVTNGYIDAVTRYTDGFCSDDIVTITGSDYSNDYHLSNYDRTFQWFFAYNEHMPRFVEIEGQTAADLTFDLSNLDMDELSILTPEVLFRRKVTFCGENEFWSETETVYVFRSSWLTGGEISVSNIGAYNVEGCRGDFSSLITDRASRAARYAEVAWQVSYDNGVSWVRSDDSQYPFRYNYVDIERSASYRRDMEFCGNAVTSNIVTINYVDDESCDQNARTLEQLSEDMKVSVEVYPNPATGHFVVAISAQSGTLDIFDIAGKKLQNYVLELGENSFSTEGLPLGLVVLEITTDEGIEVIKLKVE